MITRVFGWGRSMLAGPATATLLGAVACGGSAFSAGDASTMDGAPDDASRIVVVVGAEDASAPADMPPADAGEDARVDGGADADSGDATRDAGAVCVPGTSCVTSHADASVCDGDGGCAETLCDPGYLDCDHDPTNGCETEYNTLSCGACEAYCNPAHVIRAACTSQTAGCVYNACMPGYGDCDGDKSNGCETPTDGGPCPPL